MATFIEGSSFCSCLLTFETASQAEVIVIALESEDISILYCHLPKSFLAKAISFLF